MLYHVCWTTSGKVRRVGLRAGRFIEVGPQVGRFVEAYIYVGSMVMKLWVGNLRAIRFLS